jgi:hypothetical protein
MVSPIGGVNQPQIPPDANQVRTSAVRFREQIDAFAGDLRQILENPSLSQDPQYLTQLKSHIVSLNELAQQINAR